ncbi:hypothetical protein DV737_g2727, partial [Chaetothyriales sp. CBS 132003]
MIKIPAPKATVGSNEDALLEVAVLFYAGAEASGAETRSLVCADGVRIDSLSLGAVAAGMSTARRLPMVETQSEVDLHQLLVPTPSAAVQRARDSASASSGPSSDAGSFVIPDTLSRSNSVYSFSRASFGSQIAGLSSMSLPQPEVLLTSINGLSSSKKAIKALNGAAEQILLWAKRALKVLENLDADEDVEWAAAGGRDGLDETEKTVNRFENLVNVYVISIEELQSRPDIVEVRPEDLQGVVEAMETVLDSWENVRTRLKKVHEQVELAMEWQELWSTILQEVGAELDSLSQLVFEMEEKRHQAYKTDAGSGGPARTIDLNELESFIDEPREKRQTPNSRFSLPPAFEGSPLGSPIIENAADDSNLLALFARMQPLRASLDFLPMRLSMFQTRAQHVFPEACRELDDKRNRLEKNWSDLSKEAENLRRELSEDRWVIVFRNAGRQAQKMCESVERSVAKVQEAINEGYQRTHPSTLAKRVESFEAKKMHYGPAIQRVLAIIQKGLKDRLTVNGEILRLHKDLSSRMQYLTDAMDELDHLLKPISSKQNTRLRESISSIVSADRSFSSATMAGTPDSSPASSIDLSAHGSQKPTPKYGLNGYTKPRSTSTSRPPPLSQNKRNSFMPQHRRAATPLPPHSASTLPRRAASPVPGPPSVYRQGVYTPPTNPTARPTPTPLANKPRWVSTVRSDESSKYRSVSSSVAAPNQKYWTPRSFSSSTALPLRSPLAREASSSPSPAQLSTPPTAQKDHLPQYRSFAERIAEPSPPRSGALLDPVPHPRGRNPVAYQHGLIRSPSSMTMHSNQSKSTPTNATPPLPSSLGRAPHQSISPRVSSLNSRLEPKSHHFREPSLSQTDVDDHDNRNLDWTVEAMLKVPIRGKSSATESSNALTKAVILPLFEVAGHPIIWHCLQAVAKVKVIKEVILIGYYDESVFREFIKDSAKEFPQLKVTYLREYKALGTAGGLYHFRDAILKGKPEQFFVLNADVCSSFPLEQMLRLFQEKDAEAVILGTRVTNDAATNFGCIVSDAHTKRVLHYVEKPESQLSNLINCGVYLFATDSIFPAIRTAIKRRAERPRMISYPSSENLDQSFIADDEEPEKSEVIRLEQDILSELADSNRFFVLETKDFWRQIKTAGSAIPANALYLQKAFQLQSDELAKPSATIVPPVFIHPTAEVDPTAKLGPNVSIGPRVVVGPGARIKESIVLEDAEIKHDACVLYAIIGWNSRVGAWARVEGTPTPVSSHTTSIIKNGVKVQAITILGKETGVGDEVRVQNCICLPYKELKRDVANEVIM